ncbi:MAG: leucyl aminopeptidase, partial [bacterium]|nr:leucyl aminopeptidase [bacterium]
MKIALETRSPAQGSGDLLVIPFIDKKLLSHSSLGFINKKFPELNKLLKKAQFKGEAGSSRLVHTVGRLKFDYVLVVGLGEGKKLSAESLRKAAGLCAKEAKQNKIKKMVSLLSLVPVKKVKTKELGQALAEGTLLASYRFDKFKGKKGEKDTLAQVSFFLSGAKAGKDLRSGLKVGEATSAGTCLARDMVNTPPRDLYPEQIGRMAKKLKGVRTRVFNHRQIEKMGMGALHGVGMGSAKPPVLIEMHYKPRGRIKKRVAIVGKGITFDSGGLSLKPPQHMETMKDDMAGSAAVLGTMKVLPAVRPHVEVWAYIASAENMPDGKAQRPGDVVKAYNGKTVEVLNTDAEGRLALADALSYITKHRKVDYIIDAATLTGAALVALGDSISAVLGTDEELIQKLIEAGKFAGEKIWELPLEEDYAEGFK